MLFGFAVVVVLADRNLHERYGLSVLWIDTIGVAYILPSNSSKPAHLDYTKDNTLV
jgi:hypothetical protein